MRPAVRAAAAALVAAAAVVSSWTVVATAQTLSGGPREVVVIGVEGWSLERMLADAGLAAVAGHGGIGVYPDLGRPPRVDAVSDEPASAIDGLLRDSDADDVLVVVVGLTASEAMREAGDGLLPILAVRGAPDALLGPGGAPGTLTSTSTHRDGVVSVGDIDASRAAFLAGEEPPIRVVDGPPPTTLHARYLEHREVATPFGVATGLAVSALGLLAIAALHPRSPRAARHVLSWAALAVPGLALALLALGSLPTFTMPVVVASVLAATAAILAAAALLGRRDDDRVPVALGALLLAGFAIVAATGWDGALLPLLGGTQLDGARFYGLPNAFIGVLLGAALAVATAAGPLVGTGLLVGAGLFAGLPGLGSNVGGATTLFAAAGFWWALRTSSARRVGLRGVVAAGLIGVVGLGVAASAHALATTPTHVTAFVRSGAGIAGFIARYVDRLEIGRRMLIEHPYTLIPVAGLLAMVVVLLRPPAVFAAGFERRPAWRDVAWVCVLAGVVAYLANDSGASAAAFGFGWALVLTLWASLRHRTDTVGR